MNFNDTDGAAQKRGKTQLTKNNRESRDHSSRSRTHTRCLRLNHNH